MADNDSRRGAVNLGVPLMIVAFIVIGGFLYWLNLQAQAEREQMQIIEDSIAAAEAAEDSMAVTVQAEDIQTDAAPFEGEKIRLQNLPVASVLGSQGFWLGMPNGNPFLVSMSDQVMAEGVSPAQGDTTTVIGTIVAVNDSVLNAWTDAGTIGEGDRLAAEFATYFLDAEMVRIESGGGEGNGGGEG